MRIFAVMFSALLWLTGCASVTPEECVAGDWHMIGARDGSAGRVAQTQFDRHVNACSRVDITPDRARWDAGYALGLESYCTPRRGLSEGEAGRLYRDVCPAALESRFLRGYELGLSAYRERQRIQELERELSSLQRANSALASATQQQNSLQQWRANQSEIMFLRLQIGIARTALSGIEREIRAFRATL